MIEFNHLTKTYNGINAVDNLSLVIRSGDVYGLLGPNGAGKSTTILMLCGLIQPTSGECLINGVEVSKNPIDVKRIIGYMPEDVGFYANLTAAQNLHFFGRLYGMPEKEREERIASLLRLVGLGGVEKKVGGFSKGMRQRLGIAKTLINDPEVIILDEPTANLDPPGVADYRNIIRQISDSGKTVLVSSHILSEVSKVCTKIGIMHNGRLIHEGQWQDFAESVNAMHLPEMKINVETTSPMPDLKNPGIIRAEYAPGRRRAKIVASSDIRAELSEELFSHSIIPKEMALDATTVEDAILSFYHDQEA
ncbi:MAG: ABC transporter ATP-binding protein [Methanomicrobiales archaeon]|nr:ABC transporter ATP-binding protein [Methanomicrobiales archaeon]